MHVNVVLNFDPSELVDTLNWSSSGPHVSVRLQPFQSKYLAALQQRLREYVDAWIKCGVRQDGSEAPGDRSHDRVIQLAVDPSGTPEELMLANSFGFFCDTHILKINFPLGSKDPTLEVSPQEAKPHTHVHQKATSLVVGLLLSDLRYRIAKCRYEKCGQYFFLKGKAREKVYAHGLFCSTRCNRAASAVKLTKQRRGRFNPMVIAWAAELLRQQKNKPGDGETAKRKLLQIGRASCRERV